MDLNKQAIVATLCYSDIFDYPLTPSEIWEYLIYNSKFKVQKSKINDALGILLRERKITKLNEYFCLKGREEIIEKRIARKKISMQKITLAKTIGKIFFYIPTIQLICISGSLAMENAIDTDDIDFFIIVRKNTLWITRLLLFCLTVLMGRRRKRNVKIATNAICINMLIDEKNLNLPIADQSLYTAHEIVQMQPIFIRDNLYQKFIQENMWIYAFIPNFTMKKYLSYQSHVLQLLMSYAMQLLEPFVRTVQFLYMKPHITTETVTKTFLAFHASNNRERISQLFKERIKKYAI